jgi:hypothetical protein
MPRTLTAAVLLALLALLTPGEAVAGPPEGASGKMVFDEVADGLRQYRKATSLAVRIKWLEKLTPTRDPRVVIAICEAFEAGTQWWGRVPPPDKMDEEKLGDTARRLQWVNFVPTYGFFCGNGLDVHLLDWWKKNEADLRRRAAQLPR